MTPLHIQILLHYHTRAEPYAVLEPEHARSDAVSRFKGELITEGLICHDPTTGSGYAITPRGRALVEFLCDTPLPICKWVRP